jgi:hypothetical protein
MQLIDEAWKRGHVLSRDVELFRWQYPLRPDGSHSILAARNAAGRPEGLLGAIPVEFNLRGKVLPGAVLALWFVRPDCTDGSAGLRLLQRLFAEGYAFVGVLGIKVSALSIYHALRFHVVPRIERWVRCYDVAGLRALLAANPQPYPSEAVAHWTNAAASGPNDGDYELHDWTRESENRWDDAWRDRFAPGITGVRRTAAYLQWRYARHPRFKYVLRVAVHRASRTVGGLAAYRIADIRDRPERVLRIVEFLADGGAAASLAADVDLAARREAVTFADFYCTSARFAEPLRRLGFSPESASPAPLPSLFQPLDFTRAALNGAFYLKSDGSADSASLFAGDDVYFTRGDGDQDRPS